MQGRERGSLGGRPAGWVGVLVLAGLGLLAGVAAGYLAAVLARDEPTTLQVARPLAARSPSVPSDPAISWLPDSGLPPLGTNLAYRQQRFGKPSNRWAYDVPTGWVTVAPPGATDVRWTLPGNPSYSYSLRVEILDQLPITPSQAARNRIQGVREGEDHVELVGLDDDEVAFTYDLDGRQRYQHSRWLTTAGSSLVAFEVTVSGRMVDRPGLEALLEHVAASAHPL